MRCRACNVILTDYEATRKYADAPNVYIDLCNNCFNVANNISEIDAIDNDEFAQGDIHDMSEMQQIHSQEFENSMWSGGMFDDENDPR